MDHGVAVVCPGAMPSAGAARAEPAFDRLVSGALEAALAALAAWTLAYHLVLAARWPAGWLAVLWPAFLVVVAGIWIGLRRRARTARLADRPAEDLADKLGGGTAGGADGRSTSPAPPSSPRVARAASFLVLWLGATAAVYTLVINRPDSDDVAYYRRAAIQAEYPERAIILSNLTYDLPIQDIVPTQYLVAYEMLPALVGRWTGLDGLNLYYNVAPALAALALPAVYYLIFRQLGLPVAAAAVAVAGVVMFLLLDGNEHWSPGNFALVRLWQGKCLLVTLGLPWLLLLSWRYLECPTAAAWYSLALSGVAALGFSASGAFLAPAAVLVAVSAHAVAGVGQPNTEPPPWPRRLRRGAVALLSAFYPVAVVLLFRLLFPDAGRQIALVPSLGGWWEIAERFGDRWTVPAYGGLLLGSAWLVLAWRQAARVVLLTLANAAWFFNPICGAPLLRVLGDVYFRLFYLFPVALGAGLALAALGFPLQDRTGRAARWRVAAALALCAVFLVQARPTYSPNNVGAETSLELKRPLEYRFPVAVRRFLEAAGGRLDGRVVLAPWEVAVAAGVACPGARFVITRECYSQWSFALAARQDEYASRRSAQRWVSGGPTSPEAAEALRRVVADGADALVLAPGADRAAVVAALEPSAARWRVAVEAGGYCLLLCSRADEPSADELACSRDAGSSSRERPSRPRDETPDESAEPNDAAVGNDTTTQRHGGGSVT